jgi:hypothetical protein
MKGPFPNLSPILEAWKLYLLLAGCLFCGNVSGQQAGDFSVTEHFDAAKAKEMRANFAEQQRRSIQQSRMRVETF